MSKFRTPSQTGTGSAGSAAKDGSGAARVPSGHRFLDCRGGGGGVLGLLHGGGAFLKAALCSLSQCPAGAATGKHQSQALNGIK
jgi:hypothetical protein